MGGHQRGEAASAVTTDRLSVAPDGEYQHSCENPEAREDLRQAEPTVRRGRGRRRRCAPGLHRKRRRSAAPRPGHCHIPGASWGVARDVNGGAELTRLAHPDRGQNLAPKRN